MCSSIEAVKFRDNLFNISGVTHYTEIMERELLCTLCQPIEGLSMWLSDDPHPICLQTASDLFHLPCARCSPVDAQGQLCSICRHLRLQHLLMCKLPDDIPSHIYVTFGRREDIEKLQNCKLHRLITVAVEAFCGAFNPPIDARSSICIPILEPETPHQQITLIAEASAYCQIASSALFAFNPTSIYLEDFSPLPSHIQFPNLIDWKRSRNWISSCEQTHGTCNKVAQQAAIGTLPVGIRILDVQDRRIVQPATTSCRYVALSYTWGVNPDVTRHLALRSTIKSYESRDGLCKSRMPAAIEDAMQMCKKLGERYLWVDRLCIVQDGPHDQEVQIAGMAAIFSQAAFTIIIACGEGMETLLPGVRKSREYSTASGTMDGLHIRTCLPSFDETVARSNWASRGWTYQEALLSHRKLYVSSAQTFWVCSAGMISEDLIPSRTEADFTDHDEPVSTSATDALRYHGNRFRCYMAHAVQYNKRSLTHVSDIHRAFTGIISALYPSASPGRASLYNLPLEDFDAALLWYPSDQPPVVRSGNETTYIPSWSWSSVVGDFHVQPHFFGSLVKWFIVAGDSDGNTATIQSIDSSDSVFLESQSRLVTDTAYWSNKQFPPQLSPYVMLAILYGCLELPINRDWLSFLKGRFKHYLDTTLPPLPLANPRRTLLITRAQTAAVKLIVRSHPYPNAGCDGKRYCPLILDVKDEPLGFYISSSVLPRIEKTKGMTFEAIAISVGKSTVSPCCFAGLYEPVDEENQTELYCEEPRPLWPKSDLTFSAPVLNIMILGRIDRIHFRYGIGEVYLRRWANLERRFETIVLC